MGQDAVFVHLPQQMLKVLSNGSVIEVVAPQFLKYRAVGLCGDMNGERSADLKTPRMCVLRPRLAALSFMLNKSGAKAGFERCSGIPATLKEEFVRETTKCPREAIIPTPVSRLYEHISLLYPHNIPHASLHYRHNIPHASLHYPHNIVHYPHNIGNGTFVLWELTVNIQCCLVESKHKTS